jgi:hypothetical protein
MSNPSPGPEWDMVKYEDVALTRSNADAQMNFVTKSKPTTMLVRGESDITLEDVNEGGLVTCNCNIHFQCIISDFDSFYTYWSDNV